MITQFPEFKKIELSDKEEVSEITSKYDLYSDFEFGSLWSWDVKEEIELSILNNNLVVRFTDYVSGEPFLGFIGTTEVTDTVEKLLAYSQEKSYQQSLSLVPECAIHGLDPEKFEIEESRDHFDYVLDVSRYVDYSGGKLKARRNFFNGFLKTHPDYESTTLDLTDDKTKEEVSELYRKWQEAKGFLTLSEAFAYERFLQHSNNFTYLGVGIRVHGKLVAFHISMLPKGKVANGLFEKADTAYHGIHAILMHELAKKLLERGYTYLNYEQDLGIENLRKSKLAYDPVYFMKKYNVRLREMSQMQAKQDNPQ